MGGLRLGAGDQLYKLRPAPGLCQERTRDERNDIPHTGLHVLTY